MHLPTRGCARSGTRPPAPRPAHHDWNERITAECYAPNATARVLNGEGRIIDSVSNYSRISFNFGPTLLAWMKRALPEVHEAIVEADRRSREKFSGHGSALAQVYNHMILPLANRRDKYTQVLWGIRDFEFRFGRKPEGMWLSETAADTETLDVLTELGIRFTILSPFQAKSVRELAANKPWQDVNGGCIDPSRAYLCKLPSGREISLFFYDAAISQAIAFEHLLPIGTTEKAMRRLAQSRILVALEGVEHGFEEAASDDIFTWTLQFLLAHLQDDRSARATLQRMERVEGGGDDRRVVDYTAPAPASGGERVVVEFQNDGLAHFFYTADAEEAAMLDAGVIVPGWRRTGFTFKGWDRDDASGDASCRYYTSRDGVYSHFYSIWAPECAILAADPLWRFEAQAFRATRPSAEDCPAGHVRVTRVYNLMDGGAPNHRFLTSASEIAHMADEDWLVEGSLFCTPP